LSESINCWPSGRTVKSQATTRGEGRSQAASRACSCKEKQTTTKRPVEQWGTANGHYGKQILQCRTNILCHNICIFSDEERQVVRENDGVCVHHPKLPTRHARPAAPPPPPSPRRPRQSPRGKGARRARVPGPHGPHENLSPRCVSAPSAGNAPRSRERRERRCATYTLAKISREARREKRGKRKGCTIIETPEPGSRQSKVKARRSQGRGGKLTGPEVSHHHGHARIGERIPSAGRWRPQRTPAARKEDEKGASRSLPPRSGWVGPRSYLTLL